jgi:hypothetical protein
LPLGETTQQMSTIIASVGDPTKSLAERFDAYLQGTNSRADIGHLVETSDDLPLRQDTGGRLSIQSATWVPSQTTLVSSESACGTSYGDGVPSGVGGIVRAVLVADVTMVVVGTAVVPVGTVVVVGTGAVERCGWLYVNLGSMS